MLQRCPVSGGSEEQTLGSAPGLTAPVLHQVALLSLTLDRLDPAAVAAFDQFRGPGAPGICLRAVRDREQPSNSTTASTWAMQMHEPAQVEFGEPRWKSRSPKVIRTGRR